jgi:hypothetical protein
LLSQFLSKENNFNFRIEFVEIIWGKGKGERGKGKGERGKDAREEYKRNKRVV